MDRVAVFVDAGYLCAQGSVAIAGSKQPRSLIDLNETSLVAELIAASASLSGGLPLLRIYWYDGVSMTRGPTVEHIRLGNAANVKVRLGFLNSVGEQKGVDSLIVTDLIDLARNGAMADAVLVSGDEDIRIGVQIAQSFGVRLHLIGIDPCRGSQSLQLMQEADTTTEWTASTVSKFLSVRIPAVKPIEAIGAAIETPTFVEHGLKSDILAVAKHMGEEISDTDVIGVQAFWQAQRGVPPEFDGKLLGKTRDALGRDLTPPEKKQVRAAFSEVIRGRLISLAPSSASQSG
jgi:hypothetical protein